MIRLIAGACVMLGIFVAAAWLSAGESFQELREARKSCEAQVPLAQDLMDDDAEALLVGPSFNGRRYQTNEDWIKEATIDAVGCLLEVLDAPDDLVGRVLDTGSVRPMAVAEWSQYRIMWLVRPSGPGRQLEVAIKRRDVSPATIDYSYP